MIDYERYKTVTTSEELLALEHRLWKAELLAIDTETTGLNFMEDRLVGISLADGTGDAWYIPVAHETDLLGIQNAKRDEVIAVCNTIFFIPQTVYVAHNWKFDHHILVNNGFPVPESVQDTQIMAHSMDMGRGRFGLDFLVKEHLKHEMIPIKSIIKVKNRLITFDKVPIEKAATYAAEDADATAQLYLELSKLLGPMLHLYTHYNLPFATVLWHMEQTGIMVDVPYLNMLSKEYQDLAEKTYNAAMAMIPEPINLASPKQLGKVLFEYFKLKPLKQGKTGPSTDRQTLAKHAEFHDFPRMVLEHREYKKLDNTYAAKLPKLADANHRVHTSLNPTGTATGRLSSSVPNLQNIPIRTEQGKKLRRAFVASEGHVLIAADYSQIELRILAHFSQDERLITAYQNGEDIHQLTASQVFDVELENVSHEQRRQAKTINFGLVYGMGPKKFAREFKVSEAEAQAYLDRYFTSYPGVKAFLSKTADDARKSGYTSTMMGARRYLPDLNSDDPYMWSRANRLAGNTPIQGTAADVIKIAMLDIHRAMWPRTKLLLQVHDELVLEVAEEFAEEELRNVVSLMEYAGTKVGITVPLKVEAKIGQNWAEAH